MPFLDWQFIVVTAVAVAAVGVLVRRIVPLSRRGPGGAKDLGCTHCASSAQGGGPARARRTTTTPVVPLDDLRRTANRG